MATFVKYGPLTGSGYVATTLSGVVVARVIVTDLGNSRVFGEPGNPQKRAQIGWIGVYEDALVPDGDWDGTLGPLVIAPTWIQFSGQDMDFTNVVFNLNGMDGYAYNLFPAIALDLYAYV